MTCTLRAIPSLARNRGPAGFLLGFALLLFALPAAPQTEDPTLDAPVRFLIESITVEGVDRPATREIVAKESRIAPGSEVDEEDLRQAIYRVKRLPFVVDADFALRKGSERGRYELVIRIEMASSIFADLGAGTQRVRGAYSYGRETDWFGTVGARRFVGARGYAFGSIDRDRNLQLGYTQFHLFGPGSYLSTVVNSNLEDESNAYSLALSAGKPITARQVLRAVASYGDSGSTRVIFRSIALEWSFDSTDDPLLPTQGETLSASAGYGDSRASFVDFPFFTQSRSRQVGALARRYRSLAPRQSVWGELSGSWNEVSFLAGSEFFGSSRYSFESGSAVAGYSWDLIRSQVGEPRNDLRFTAQARLDVQSNALVAGLDPRVLSLETALIYRRPQGSIRLSFKYVDPSRRRLFQ
jgi:hypothetical protein